MIPSGFITVSSRRVLIVENSPSDRQLLRNWLNGEMIETQEAVDIITALSACQKYQPNLILLQLRLNTWDGYEVIKRLKEDPRTRSVPVIFLAASALTQEKAKGIDMGAVDFVSKPYDAVELLARVNSALRTKALLDLLDHRAHLDGLTELGNRFALQDALPMQFAASRQKGSPLCILIADIDHFKRVNDLHGHAAGDEVLRRMAMTLRASVRPNDFLARYGGEEFVVLCPDCELSTALQTAEKIRSAMADLKVLFRNSLIHATLSVGVACIESPYVGTPEEFLERADESLYKAKANGRNAVWYWDNNAKAAVCSTASPNPAAPQQPPSPAPRAEPPPPPPAPKPIADPPPARPARVERPPAPPVTVEAKPEAPVTVAPPPVLPTPPAPAPVEPRRPAPAPVVAPKPIVKILGSRIPGPGVLPPPPPRPTAPLPFPENALSFEVALLFSRPEGAATE